MPQPKPHSVVEARIMTLLLTSEKPLTYDEVVNKLYGNRTPLREFENMFDFLQEQEYIRGWSDNGEIYWTVTLDEFTDYLDYIIEPKEEWCASGPGKQ